MTRKQFKEHEWKVGEILYTIKIKYVPYLPYEIPIGVMRIKIKLISDGWFRVNPTNKKFQKYMDRFRYKFTPGRYCAIGAEKLFFTKEDALKKYDKICEHFIRVHRTNIINAVKSRIRENEHEIRSLLNVFKLNIMVK